MATDKRLVEDLRAGLATAADPAKAGPMQAYMKSDLPYYGVPAPAFRLVFRGVQAAHPLDDRAAWRDTALAMWDGATYREERYGALALLGHRRYRGYLDPALLPDLAYLVRTGAWWDVVDEIAIKLVGAVLLAHPAEATPVVRGWATDEDRWLRRTAVICQVGAKERTDLDLLLHAVDANVDDRDFFLRKAIGWALRQYARVDPEWVRAEVAARSDRLSGLSTREALKHVGAA